MNWGRDGHDMASSNTADSTLYNFVDFGLVNQKNFYNADVFVKLT